MRSTRKALLGVSGIAVAAALFGCSEPAPVSPLDAAYAAVGGDTLKSISLKSHWDQWDPGESYAVSDPLMPDDGSSELVQTRDLATGATRNEWVRPNGGGGSQRTYTEIVTPAAGIAIGIDAVGGRLPKRTDTAANPPIHTMSGARLTATLRELERADIVREMHRHRDKVVDLTPPGGGPQAVPTFRYTSDHGVFTVMLDPMTNLPTHVTSKDWDALFGDSDYDAAFSDWRDVDGVKIPFKIEYTLSGTKIADVTVSDVTVNPMLDAASFEIPQDKLAMAAKPAPMDATPFQWIIRRQFTGFYLDSDAMYTDDGDALKLVDVAPNVSQVVGGTHNSLVIATNTYLVVVDAPNDDGQSKQTIDLATAKYPGKPIKYLILTHHHVDHAGGMRAYAAAGATVVVGPGDGDAFKKWLASPHATDVNGPQGAIMPEVVEVTDKWSVNDGGRVIEAYPIENPHAGDMLIAYLPQVRLGFVTDLWNPGAPVENANPGQVAFVDAVAKAKLRPLKFAGGHGAVGNYSDIAAAVAKAKSAAPK
jgi:glyoxylase-like metal-dependent hydrolase (beta-lactamase superfamily II)